MEHLFKASDVISLHCPLTKDNSGFVNQEYLSRMKASAVLINTSRGQLINETDLAAALQKKVLTAAALDVLSVEPPPPDHPLIGIPDCIITPHNAWSSFEARSRIMEVTYQNIQKFLDGNPQNLVFA
jgi:glycerate dehydrogenase